MNNADILASCLVRRGRRERTEHPELKKNGKVHEKAKTHRAGRGGGLGREREREERGMGTSGGGAEFGKTTLINEKDKTNRLHNSAD